MARVIPFLVAALPLETAADAICPATPFSISMLEVCVPAAAVLFGIAICRCADVPTLPIVFLISPQALASIDNSIVVACCLVAAFSEVDGDAIGADGWRPLKTIPRGPQVKKATIPLLEAAPPPETLATSAICAATPFSIFVLEPCVPTGTFLWGRLRGAFLEEKLKKV